MAVRINALSGASSINTDDKLAIDGTTSGARSYPGAGANDKILSTNSSAQLIERAFLDEDDLSSDSATGVPSQQSVKAYVDAYVVDTDQLAASAVTSAKIGAKQVTLEKLADGTAGYIIGYNASTGVAEARAESTGGSSSEVTVVEGAAADDNITAITSATDSGSSASVPTTEARWFYLDQNFSIANDIPEGRAWVVKNTDTASITATITAGAGGTGVFSDGETTRVIPAGGVVSFFIRSNAGDEPQIEDTGDRATVDYGGRVVSGGLVGFVSPAGAHSVVAADLNKRITSAGNVTIPTSLGTGAWFEVKLGGDHDLLFNSTTLDVSAQGWGTGDNLRVTIVGATSLEVERTAAASIIDQTDFA